LPNLLATAVAQTQIAKTPTPRDRSAPILRRRYGTNSFLPRPPNGLWL
jgi:hypothetical protein